MELCFKHHIRRAEKGANASRGKRQPRGATRGFEFCSREISQCYGEAISIDWRKNNAARRSQHVLFWIKLHATHHRWKKYSRFHVSGKWGKAKKSRDGKKDKLISLRVFCMFQFAHTSGVLYCGWLSWPNLPPEFGIACQPKLSHHWKTKLAGSNCLKVDQILFARLAT